MVIDFSKVNLKERPMLVLRNLDSTPIQVLGYAYNVEPEIYYNEMSSLTFDLPEHVDGVRTPGYDDVIGTRIVDLVGYGQFILVDPKIENDGVCEIKSCKAYSLEYELTYKKLSLEEGTYNFWNPLARKDTIIDIILSYLPSWSIGEIDDALIGRYRTFDVGYENIYNFIKSTLQQKYGCIFDFDTYKREINVKAVSSYTEVSPVYISLENLASNISVEEDTENIFTVLDVNGAEGVTIRSVNPLGTNKIYNLDYYMNTSHFSEEMIDKWMAWKDSFTANQLIYYNLTTEQALKTAAILTEQHKLTEMEDAELAALETEQSVYIEYLASISKESDDYDEYSDLLAKTTEKIAAKKRDISSQKAVVSELESEKADLTFRLKEINDNIAFDKFFTSEELRLLDRYFKEDAIEDSSFVYKEAETYVDDDLSSHISGVDFVFDGGEVVVSADEGGRKIYMIRGGKLTSGEISAAVIRASVEFKNDGTLVMGGYLQTGSIGNMTFPSGCVSLTGSFLNFAFVAGESLADTSLHFTADSAYLYFTKNTTEYERRAVEWDLYEYGAGCLEKLASPSYSFDVDAANFFFLDEYLAFASKIALGNKLYLRLGENETLQPILIGVKFNFDDLDSLKLHFGDTYSASKSSFDLVDLLEQSVSMGKTVDTSRFSYNSFVDSGASSAVRDFMTGALDASKNAILSGENMAISWDASGIKCRKWNDAGTDYEKEQIAIINNNIVFTDDGWQTAKMAIGKFVDPNLGVSWGMVAPNIVGTLFAGENLVIDTENGSFRVDSSGVHINSLKFLITHGDTTESMDDYMASRDDTITENYQNAIIDAMKKTVETYYQEDMPGVDSTETLNVGDLWYVSGTKNVVIGGVTYESGRLYRWNGKSWELIKDEIIEQAAKDAQTTADGKITSFYQNEVPVGASHGDIWYALGTVPSGYTSGKIYRYNSNSKKWDIIEDKSALEAIKALEDGMIVTYYDNQVPKEPHVGDLWYVDSTGDVTSGGKTYKAQKLYRYNGSAWEPIHDAEITKAIEAAKNAQDTADGKIVSYYTDQTPTDASSGDIWYVTGKNSEGYVVGKLYRYNGTKWELVEDGDIPGIKEDIKNTNTAVSDIAKRIQDAIAENGWVNANHMQGIIDTQMAQMKSAAGNVLFDKDGLWLMNTSSKENATTAVWMNEKGILLGSGNASSDPAKNFTWKTAISSAGIAADAIAAGTLSGMKIVGGELNIGNGNFVVTNGGDLTANTGTFKGTVQGAKFVTSGGTPMMGENDYKFKADYLNLRGIEITHGSTTTFKVDSASGAVTINGATSISGNITMNGGTINWDNVPDNGALQKARDAASDASDALDAARDAARDAADALKDASTAEEKAEAADALANALLKGKRDDGTQITGMYIYSPNIYSPNIYANKYNLIGVDNFEGVNMLTIQPKQVSGYGWCTDFSSGYALSFSGTGAWINTANVTIGGSNTTDNVFIVCKKLDFSDVEEINDPNGVIVARFG